MSFELTIRIDADKAKRMIDNIGQINRRFMPAFRAEIDKVHQTGLGRIIEERFTGAGPFPFSANKLGVRTGLLRRSLRFTGAVIDGDTIRDSVGSPVEYFGIHEFGFSGPVNVKAHTRNRAGRTEQVRAHVRQLSIPARAPMRTGLRSQFMTDLYAKAANRALDTVLNAGGAS